MMMNDFGVPMSDAEMSMQAPGAMKPHEQMLAESGKEMQLGPLAAIGIGAGLSFLSGASNRSASKKASRREEEYLDRLLGYQNESWNMNRNLSISNRNESIRKIKLDQKNEIIRAKFQDANRAQEHAQAVSIWDYQNRQWDREFDKSEDLYHSALSLNARSAQLAREDEVSALMEERQKYAFENENKIMKNLQETGALAASGIQGRSAAKAGQAQMAALGRNQAVMTESLVSATKNTQRNLRSINHELDEANTQARSRRMLKPEYSPKPLAPIKTPISEYEFPRELQDFDFGPKPIRGQSTISTPSWGSVFLGAATSGFNMYSGIEGAIKPF